MAAPDLVIRSRRVVTPEGIRPAAVVVTGGRIEAVVGHSSAGRGARVEEDVGDLAVLPGLVDSHVHVNEPGRTDWEGFATATRAAAAGGITTIVDMPLNSVPPTTTVAALEAKRAAAADKAHVDVAFWGGLVPGSSDHVAALHHAGVAGFKVFLCDSGVPEYGSFAPADAADLLTRTSEVGSTLIAHAEDPRFLEPSPDGAANRYTTWLAARPPAAEEAAVAALVEASRTTSGRLHVVHVSAASAAERIAAARASGVLVTAETCPHYLVLAAEEVPDGATVFKCAPPIRDRANAERLWALLDAGALAAVVSDHSPCPPQLKDPQGGDFLAAWGGIASLQLGLSLVWTAARERGHDLGDVVRWMAAGPAALAGLARKGAIAPGRDADLVVLDEDAEWTVDAAALHHRHPVTPYHGRRVIGRVRGTYVRGHLVARDGRISGPPQGRLLGRADMR